LLTDRVSQDFYNIPVNDPLHENLVLQHQREQLGRNRHDAAWCPGSGFIFKRAAWEKVSGFFERSMCDDVYFGWSLNGAGYKTVYVNACLQSGLQPESFQDHMKQRRRWVILDPDSLS
jgi:cellulose synthase/poly-beta-1,6-N-acetylglucosamine synthase-like glycosyltransferase